MIRSSRVLTAIILLPILVTLIWTLPPFGFFLFISLVILRVQYEFYLLYLPKEKKGSIFFGLGLGFLFLSAIYFRLSPLSGILVLIMMLCLLHTLSTFKDIKPAFSETAVLFMGIIYIPGFLSHLILIRNHPAGIGLISLLLLMIWGGDAGAYYIGRGMGKRKLSPRVSPNKTVEGAIGGIIVTFLAASVAKLTFLPLFSWTDLLVLSPLLAVFGILGDLCESMLKRSAGVKDSSALVPSHGGLFDKLDSIAFAAPLLYYYLIFAKG